MKQFSLTGATTVFLMSTGLSGYASDVSSSMAALPRMPLYNWTGFYVGANLGGAWASDRLNDSFTGASAGLSTGGFIGGGQLGYNFQAGNFVFGAEWVLNGAPLNTSGSLGSSLVASANTSWVTTLAARFGWAFDKYLWFGKAGGDWGKDRATLANVRNGAQVNASNTNTGWLWGTGIEYAFAPNWTGKLEYDYPGMNTWKLNSTVFGANGDQFIVKRRINMFVGGVNYKFW
jgi:outer membrane immunogenic protein